MHTMDREEGVSPLSGPLSAFQGTEREWAPTNLAPGGRDRGSWVSGNRVYGGKSVTREALHPHSHVY